MNQNMNPSSCVRQQAPSSTSNNNSCCDSADKTFNCFENTCRENRPCYENFQQPNVRNCESECKVVRVNLRECAAKLWNNLFGIFSEGQTDLYDNRDYEPYLNSGRSGNDWKSADGDLVGRKAVRSRSESSKYDQNKPSIDIPKAHRMKVAFKCCLLEKLSKPKICESFLLEVNQMLAKYPYTDICFYWELMQAIQAEVDEHKCKNISKSEQEDKKLKQLYLLSYAITRYILQVENIIADTSFKKSKSWNQIVGQLKDDFKNPKTGQFSMSLFPMFTSSFKQGETDSKKLCSCLPLGFFTKAIDKTTAEGQNSCMSLKVECFPNEFTCFDFESLKYISDLLQYDLQIECSKGLTGKCQVDNCPYPVPIRNERVIKELKTNVIVINQLICYLQRMSCFITNSLHPPSPICESASPNNTNPINTCANHESRLTKRRSRSILKNKCLTVNSFPDSRAACNLQVKCLAPPKLSLSPNVKCNFSNGPKGIHQAPQSLQDNNIKLGVKTRSFSVADFPKLHLKKISEIPFPIVPEQTTIVNLCCPEPEKLKNKKHRSESGMRRTKSGGGSSVCCPEDICKKCSKSNVSCPVCRERKEEKRRRRRESSKNFACKSCDDGSDSVCREGKDALICETINVNGSDLIGPPNQLCSNQNENVLVICNNPECEVKNTNLINSVSKMMRNEARKLQSKCSESADKLAEEKTSKCAGKLRKTSNIQINDCKHKKERIVRLVNLLNTNDCAFTPTDQTNLQPTDTCNGSRSKLGEVSELYEKFLALEESEECEKMKSKCDDRKTKNFIEEINDGFCCPSNEVSGLKNDGCQEGSSDSCSSKGSCKSNCHEQSCFSENCTRLARRNSVGIQACNNISKQSVGLDPECCEPSKASIGCSAICPPSKHSVGTSTLFNSSSRGLICKPSPQSISEFIEATLTDVSPKLCPPKKNSIIAMACCPSRKSRTKVFVPTKRSRIGSCGPTRSSVCDVNYCSPQRSKNKVCSPICRSSEEICIPSVLSEVYRKSLCLASQKSGNVKRCRSKKSGLLLCPSRRSKKLICLQKGRSRAGMKCSSCDMICKNAKAFKSASSRSLDRLKQKLECKYKALAKQQEQQYKMQKKYIAKKLSKKCKKCVSSKYFKSKTLLDNCFSKSSLKKSRCAVKKSKSKKCVKRKSACSIKSCRSKKSLKKRSKCNMKRRRSRSSVRGRRSRSSLKGCRSRNSLKGCRSRSSLKGCRSRSSLKGCKSRSSLKKCRSRSSLKSRRSNCSIRSCGSNCSLKKKRSAQRLRSRSSTKCKKKNCKKCKLIKSRSCTALLANIATKMDPCCAYELVEKMSKQKCKRKKKGCTSSKCKVRKRSRSRRKRSRSKAKNCRPKKLTCTEVGKQLEACTSAIMENLAFQPTQCASGYGNI